MKFLRKITQTEIFQKVAQIANTQIIQRFQRKTQPIKQPLKQLKEQQKFSQHISQNTSVNSDNKQLIYEDSQEFILQLSSNAKNIKRQQMQKKRKKQVFSELEIEPIYLQNCEKINLFKMQIEFGQGYERTQTLHNYLKQVNDTIKRILMTENLQILNTFCIVDTSLYKITALIAKIKLIRCSIQQMKTQKAQKIVEIMKRKLVIKQKLALLSKMKQKQEIILVKPQNIEQVYYTERGRHKLYLKIKNTKQVNSYFSILKNQLIQISQNNIKILEENFMRWINDRQQIKQKNIEKLLICLYFVKNQALYKNNQLDVSFQGLNKAKLIEEIQNVKNWKNYQYIRDPIMKTKIVDFLNIIIKDTQSEKN